MTASHRSLIPEELDTITGLTADALNGPMLIPEKYVQERKAREIFARLPMSETLCRNYRFFQTISGREARSFVKAVRDGRIKHSICLEICANQHLFDPDPYANTVRCPTSADDFVRLFPLMANAVIEYLAMPVRDHFDIVRRLLGVESPFGGAEVDLAKRDLDIAVNRLNGHYRYRSFSDYVRRDLSSDFFGGDTGMDWAIATLFARAGDSTALRPHGEPSAAVSIATKIMQSSVQWQQIIGIVQSVTSRDIRVLTGASLTEIAAWRSHLLEQAACAADVLSSGAGYSYQQVKFAEHYEKRGFIESAWCMLLNGREPIDFSPAADIGNLRRSLAGAFQSNAISGT